MKLKGKSVIQLYNAETGELEKEVKDNNMTTNAISNLLNWKLRDRMYSYGAANFANLLLANNLGANNKFIINMFGGLMLFDETIAENVNTVLQPASVNQIGAAGGAYNGFETTMGTLNENESGAITGGYKFVWDFGTDRCNGTIKCMSLTSRAGGDKVPNPTVLGKNFAIGSTETFSTSTTSSIDPYTQNFWIYNILGTGVDARLLGCIYRSAIQSDGTEYLICYNRSDKTIKKITVRGTADVKISDEALFSVVSIENLVSDVGQNSFNCWYDGTNINVCYMTSATALKHKKYSLAGEQVGDTISVTAPSACVNATNNTGVCTCFYLHGDYWAISSATGTPLMRFNAAGELIDTINQALANAHTFSVDNNTGVGYLWTPNQVAQIFSGSVKTGAMMSRGSSAQGCFSICYDENSNNCLTASNGYLANPNANDFNIYKIPMTQYLATINNLATPVTKTSSNTMKITYELTEST